ncbi:MAG: SNF2-related protein, partial [Limisphaerales bacterium]
MGSSDFHLSVSSWKGMFPIATLQRAGILASGGAVGPLSWDEASEHVSASVRTGPGRHFHVDIGFEQDEDGEWEVAYTECDCPTSNGCVHAAALLHKVSGAQPANSNAKAAAGARKAALGLPPQLRHWLDEMAEAAATPQPPPEAPETKPVDRLLYVLEGNASEGPNVPTVTLRCVRSRKKRDGSNGSASPYNLYNSLERPSTVFVQAEDTEIARRLFLLIPDKCAMASGSVVLRGERVVDFLPALLATGRCHWADHRSPPLRLGSTRPGTPQWVRTTAGRLRTCLQSDPPADHILAFNPPWYLDVGAGECGPLETPMTPAVVSLWLGAPSLDPLDATAHGPAIAERFQAFSLPAPPTSPVRRQPQAPPVPSLHLSTVNIPWWEAPWGFQRSGGAPLPVLAAKASFWYGNQEVSVDQQGSELRNFDGQELVLTPRDRSFEDQAVKTLGSAGLVPAREVFRIASDPRLISAWTLRNHSDAATLDFVTRVVPALRAEGWRIERDPGFALEVCQPSEWYVETDPVESDNRTDWFGLELGVRVGDEKINLLPVLLQGLQSDLEVFRTEFLKKQGPKETVLIQLPDGRRIPFPAGRLREILTALVELHSGNALAESGRLKVHRLRAAQLGELTDAPQWVWTGDKFLRDLSKRLRNMDKLPEAEAPTGLRASLRPYQLEGLRWLQFVREFQLGGVLADDMGLGKTIQTLAHLLLEKEEGRLDRPALVVSPTSVLVNWRDEISRFAPDLRVVTLHGG